MSSRRTLASLINRDFSEGYADFKELIDFAEELAKVANVSAGERGSVRILELLCVAAIEGLNDALDEHGMASYEATVRLWREVGIMLAVVNVQAFSEQFGVVQREMFAAIKGGYRDSIISSRKAETAGAPGPKSPTARKGQ